MTKDERLLLIWCAEMILREDPLSQKQAEEVHLLIDRVRFANPGQDLTLNHP